MSGIQGFFENYREKILLVLYFLIMSAAVWPLFQTLGDAWRDSEIVRPLILSTDPILSIKLDEFSVICLGLFIGLLLLFTLDPKKRWQGVLLWIGAGSAMTALLTIGLFIPNIDFTSNIAWLGAGIVVGVAAGGGDVLLQNRTIEALEFRRAGRLIFYLTSLVVVIGLVEYHLTFPRFFRVTNNEFVVDFASANLSVGVNMSGLWANSILAIVFVGTLQRFIQYDAEETFFVLGPRGAGKSLFLVGMYLAALKEAEGRKSDTPLKPSSDLMDLVSEVDAASEEAGWEIDATAAADIEDLNFQYLSGQVFPKNLELSSLDYAGEYLDELPAALMTTNENIDDSTLQVLADQVRNADTLILLIDLERYSNNETLEIEPYFDILEASSAQDVILVATKADLLAEEFREQQALEAHQYFDEFVDYVNTRLTESNQSIRTLVQDTSGSIIHPVYYQTTVRETGERVPMRDRNGNVLTMGFQDLLSKIG